MLTVKLQNALEWALMVTLVFGAGAIAQAQQDAAEPEGRIVKIGPETNSDDVQSTRPPRTDAPAADERQSDAPRYWVGLVGGPVSPELRAHLDVPEDQGVMIRQLVPDGPAAKAGLKNFDVLLRANDVDLHDMRDLADLVRTAGEQQEQITLEVLRGGERQTVWITPSERPERVTPPAGPDFGGEGAWGGDGPGMPNDLYRWFGLGFGPQNRGGLTFRRLGPGAVVGGQAFAFQGIPNGVSVSIKKENDQPAQITVRRGDESWEITGDDPKSLDELPDDLRPFVEQLLGQTVHGQFNVPLPPMPNTLEMPNMPEMPRFGDHEGRLQERLDAIERHVRELEERLFRDSEDQPPAE